MLYELLVRTVDKTNPDKRKDAGCTKRGDVIAIKPKAEAWWTEAEGTAPYWTIITADLTPEMAASLIAPEIPKDLSERKMRKRGIRLNLARLGAAATRQQITAAIEVK